MTFIGHDVCWFFDIGGDRPLSLQSLEELKKQCNFKPVTAFFSHFDKDHIKYYQLIDQFIPINQIYFSHLSPQTKLGQNLLKYFTQRGTKIGTLNAGNEFKSENSSMKCLWPRGILKKDENSRSLVFLFQNNHRKILLTGDLPSKVENKFDVSTVDILKVAHHGSQGSTSLAFLQKTKPKTCIISVGKNNKYRHPRQELLDRLKNAQCTPLRTDYLGTINLNF